MRSTLITRKNFQIKDSKLTNWELDYVAIEQMLIQNISMKPIFSAKKEKKQETFFTF